MSSKITERCINEIQGHLKDYVMEHSSKNKNRRFTCFNKSAHSHKDELENILYKICRREWMDKGQRKKDFIAYTKDNSSWSIGIKGTRHLIYKLPKVLEGIKNHKTIFFVEGEKCADYIASLKGANIVILPDGKAYAKDVLNAMKNEAKSIKIIELPGLKLKEDIVDWVGNGGTLKDLIALVNASEETLVDSGTVQDKPIGNIYENEFCYYKYQGL